MSRTNFIHVLLVMLFMDFCYSFSAGTDTLVPSQSISLGQTIVSQNDIFELGLFTGSRFAAKKKLYLGIWYKKNAPRDIVWVANTEKPLFNSSSARLEFLPDGNLVLLTDSEQVWLTDLLIPTTVVSVEGVLLSSGNFVLRDVLRPSTVFWQSFDHPTDTWLPGAKLGINTVNGKCLFLRSWTSSEDPSPGMFSFRMDPEEHDRIIAERKMQTRNYLSYWNSGIWDRTNSIFRSLPEISYINIFKFVSNKNEVYFTYSILNPTALSRIVISSSGKITQFVCIRNNCTWTELVTWPKNQLDDSSPELNNKGNSKTSLVKKLVPISISVLVFVGFVYYFSTRKFKRKGEENLGEDLLSFDFYGNIRTSGEVSSAVSNMNKGKKYPDLPFFSFASVSAATNDFSEDNKIGEGGFGSVYKGKLMSGQEIAVKRLSKRSGQGIDEYRNEVTLIARLQHRNLVRILGSCIEQDEKILIYEYLPNTSLDSFLFDPNKNQTLNWEKRLHIIEGIAHGLLYLHQYSRLRIIHRDLKANNVLLDNEMNPKISDFGIARMFQGDQLQGNTKRIVGTYGYMAPEYIMEGLFSVKSDVFSFGVLLLEIVSGKKNTGFYNSRSLNLLEHTWNLWKTDQALELLDKSLGQQQPPSTSAILKYINVGLLCVQSHPSERPCMSNVVSMLMTNEHATLPAPKPPAFCSGWNAINTNFLLGDCSTSALTISMIQPR